MVTQKNIEIIFTEKKLRNLLDAPVSVSRIEDGVIVYETSTKPMLVIAIEHLCFADVDYFDGTTVLDVIGGEKHFSLSLVDSSHNNEFLVISGNANNWHS